ncbi:unnamed protein product [Lathyrus sativus]|nr:unnamed protein product [Lathyrus sativus]
MKNIEQENHEVRKKVTALRAGMEKLPALVETLVATQNQPSHHISQTPLQRTAIFEIMSMPIPVNPISASKNSNKLEEGLPKEKEQAANAISREKHGGPRKKIRQHMEKFDTIPMAYSELYPTLIQKNLVQTRTPPTISKNLPWWFRYDRFCPFHQGAPGHDIEHCFALKAEVQKLVQSSILSFEDSGPNVSISLLPKYGNAEEGCLGEYYIST